MARQIQYGCCTNWMHKGISGQLFSPSGYNVIISYANCNHRADADRPGFTALEGSGVNGECA